MNNLKKVRESKNMSASELARAIGVNNRTYIHDLENGNNRNPSLGRARLIAMALRSDLNEIFPEEYDR